MSLERYALGLGGDVLEYTVVRRPRRTLEIAVEPDGSVAVAAPLDASIAVIEVRLRRRIHWIRQQQQYFSQFQPRTPERLFTSGETHLYLGRQYRLQVVASGHEEVKLVHGYFVVHTVGPSTAAAVSRLLDAWYRARARVKFAERIEVNLGRFASPSNFRPRAVTIRHMPLRWGSMSASGRLLLNPRLIQAPVCAIDYVITHELCHMAEPNHTSAFYALQELVLPDWEHRKSRLERALA